MINKKLTTFLATASLVAALALVTTATLAMAEDAPIQAERAEVGQLAPGFSLASSTGETHSSDALRGEKDLILIFFRGSW